ncbi:SusC/RagA family TonB-linked outer membrane protein [Pseudobacter ginsenosidimutans]|nr:SusC/RagA family TonB-linked outer membrane protein [Pseudobacter ginsenosidimutans]
MQKTASGGLPCQVVPVVQPPDRFRLPPQMMRVMRLLTFFLFAACLSASASGNAQSVTISGKALTYKQVFTAIKKQTGYVTMYDQDLFQDNKTISLFVKDLPLPELLQLIVKDQPLKYEIEDKTIFLSRKPVSFLALLPNAAAPTPLTIRVIDSTGSPLAGATVLLSRKNKLAGDKQATRIMISGVTDAKGNISLQAEEGDILSTSFIGMESHTITITRAMLDNGTLTINLKQSDSRLSDVEVTVSTGYQKIKPEHSTGSISTLRLKDYDSRINTTDFLTGLQNKIPGLLIDNNIQFEGNTLFQIRGISTINGNRQPLIVVDGFPTELTLNMIDPYEVESVTVLKDAAAATIYGARSSNGVIIIERKKAKAGKMNVNFRSTTGFTPRENYERYRWDKDASNTIISADKIVYENISPLGWMLITEPAYSDQYPYGVPAQIMAHWRSSTDPITIEERDRQLAELGSYNNTKDYKRLFLRTATTQTYNLSISGGSRDALYYLTANYLGNRATQINNNNNQFRLSGRTMLNITKRLSLDMTTDFQQARVNAAPVPDIHSIYPYEHLQDENGNPMPVFNGSYSNSFYNNFLLSKNLKDNRYYPLVDVDEVSNKSVTLINRITGNFRYNIGYGLNFNLGGVFEVSRMDGDQLYGKKSSKAQQYINRYTSFDAVNNRYTSRVPDGGILQKQDQSKQSYTVRAQLNFDKQIAGDHDLNAILGAEIRDLLERSNGEAYFGYDDQTLLHQPLDFRSLQDYFPTMARSNPALLYDDFFKVGYRNDRYISIYSNLVYTYLGKYSLSGSLRIDQSNLFGTDPKYRYKPLWSLGAAWNIHKENFMQNMEWLKSLKLRAAYGFNGNVARNSLPEVIAKAGLTNSINASYALPMLSLLSLANSGLRWEQTQNFNAGIDYELFKGITGSVDYYVKKSTDILANNQIDATKGAPSALVNQASIRNNGVEVSLHADWITRKRFNWNSGLIFSYNNSKVLNVYNKDIGSSATSYSYVFGTNANYLKGYAVGAMFGYRYKGVDAEGHPLILDKDGEGKRFFTGTDNGINDVVYLGSSIPKYNMGLSNRVDMGNFYFYCMINFYGGFNIRVPVPNARETRPLEGANNFWKKPGDETKPGILPAIATTYYSYLRYTDQYIVNSAYLTLGDLTASYTFKNSRFLKKQGINLEVRAQASNLYTVAFNKYDYSIATGSYEKTYMTPTYTMALNVNF